MHTRRKYEKISLEDVNIGYIGASNQNPFVNTNVTAESGTTEKNCIRLSEGTFKQFTRNTNFLFGTETIQTTSNHIWTLKVNAITPILQLTGVFW